MGNWRKGHQGFLSVSTGRRNVPGPALKLDPVEYVPKNLKEAKQQSLAARRDLNCRVWAKKLDSALSHPSVQGNAAKEERARLHVLSAYLMDDPLACTEAETQMAGVLHDAWRGERKLSDGTCEPQMEDDGMGGKFDIANTAYADLPPKWRHERLQTAIGALSATLEGPRDIETVASKTHEDRLSRNSEWAKEHQNVPYANLSEVEKENYRAVARIARQQVLNTKLGS